MSIEEDLQEPLLERLSATPDPGPDSSEASKSSKKRKRAVDLPEVKKNAKKAKSKKTKEDEEDELDLEAGINKAFSHMDNHLLADYIAQRTRRYESDLSSIELEDRKIPGEYCKH
jgi:protein CMS1